MENITENVRESVIMNSVRVTQIRPDNCMVNKITVYFVYDRGDSVSDIDGKHYGPGYRVIVSPERSTNKHSSEPGKVKRKGSCAPMTHTVYESGRYFDRTFNANLDSADTLRAQRLLLEKLTKEGGLEPLCQHNKRTAA